MAKSEMGEAWERRLEGARQGSGRGVGVGEVEDEGA